MVCTEDCLIKLLEFLEEQQGLGWPEKSKQAKTEERNVGRKQTGPHGHGFISEFNCEGHRKLLEDPRRLTGFRLSKASVLC